MTDKEKAIVMAYTGACMLTGDKFQIFHKYIEDIMGRPIMTHDIGWLEDEIKEKSKADFIALCTDESCSESQNKWIPVERELPELNRPLLVTAYHRVCYAHMISKSGNYGYPVFRLHELKDSDRGWVQETISHEPYSKGRIDAWMYIDIPQPYKAESEE